MRFEIILLIFGSSMAFQFEKQDVKTGLTFIKQSEARISYDTYTIVYYLDITEYKKLTKTVENFINEADVQCKRFHSTDSDGLKICYVMIHHLKKQLKYMQRDELDIEAYQQKPSKKRAIEIVGSFLHWAFGLMDTETAKEYDIKIENIGNDSQRFHNLLQEQTALIKETIELNNKTQNDLNLTMRKIKEFIRVLNSERIHEKEMNAEMVFQQGVSLANILISIHRRVSQQILHCLEEVVSGKISQLIPKDRLTQDLIHVGTFLKENQRLPIDFNIENPLHIFKYSQVSASLFGKRLLLEVTIPIVERETYTVYKIIPIPTRINNNTVIILPSSHYILLNNEAKEYIPITSKEFNKGMYNLHGEKIIKPAENARLDYEDNCEISIFLRPSAKSLSKSCEVKVIPTSNYFISLNNNDLFYVQISKPTIITEYCHKKPSKFQEIKENGLLELNKECRVVTDNISLRPRNNYKFESEEIITLSDSTQNTTFEVILNKLNFIFNGTIPEIKDNILIQDYSSDYNNLIDKAEKLIDKSKMVANYKNLNYKLIEKTQDSYIFTSVLVMIVIAIIIIVVWYLYSKFFSISTWVKLANRLNGENIPKLFVRTVNNSSRRSIFDGEMVHIDQPIED